MVQVNMIWCRHDNKTYSVVPNVRGPKFFWSLGPQDEDKRRFYSSNGLNTKRDSRKHEIVLTVSVIF